MDNTKETIELFNKHAVIYQEKFMDLGLYQDGLDLFCGQLAKQNAAVLDVACGPGNITKYLLAKQPGLQVLGIDLAPAMIDLAKTNNPSAAFQLADCRDIIAINKKFDGIICGFGLPYLSKKEALAFIHDSAAILNMGGVIYLSTMEGDNDMSGFKKRENSEEQLYVNYHEAAYLSQALEENGCTILYLQRKKYPSEDVVETIDLVIVAVKK